MTLRQLEINNHYQEAKRQIDQGGDIYEFIPAIYRLLKAQEYEAVEGIRLAIADLGLIFTIPENEKELAQTLKFIQEQKDRCKQAR